MKVAIYCRLSREDEDKNTEKEESESIQNQKSMLLHYALENHWEIYKIYCDEDYSGIDSERPEFKQLLQDGESHKFDIILCKTQSRFTRDMELVEKYLHHKFIEWNIRFITLVDHVDTEDKGNKKSRQINGLVNEWYLEDLSENIRKTFDSKRSQGLHIGAFVAYGYQRAKEDKNKLVIDQEAAEIVKWIYDLYETGKGISTIARILNQKGVLPPTKYKQEKGLKFKNQKGNPKGWSESTITKILKNELYIGNMVQGYNRKISYKSKKSKSVPKAEWIIVENTQEPIIPKQQFKKVQDKLALRTRKCKTGRVNMFANRLHCLDCGAKLYKCQNSKGYVFFSCSNARTSKKTCTRHSISEKELQVMLIRKNKREDTNLFSGIRYRNDRLSSKSYHHREKREKQRKTRTRSLLYSRSNENVIYK